MSQNQNALGCAPLSPTKKTKQIEAFKLKYNITSNTFFLYIRRIFYYIISLNKDAHKGIVWAHCH